MKLWGIHWGVAVSSDRWFYLAISIAIASAWLCRYDVVSWDKRGAVVLNRITGSYHQVTHNSWWPIERDREKKAVSQKTSGEGPTLTPVDYDPFEVTSETPVEGN